MDAMPKMPTYEAYKDSGVEWLGSVPDHWEVMKVRSSYRLLNGYPFDSAKFDNATGYPLVRIRDIYRTTPQTFFNGKYVKEAEISNDDLLVGMDGDFNVALWKGGRALLNQRVCCLRANSKIDIGFLYYCLGFPLKIINDLTFSTTVKHLSSIDILKIKISVPADSEKELIVKYLDQKTAQIDEAVAIKEQQIALLKERKQIIIQKAVTQGLDPNVPMKDSGVDWIGKIPAHWETTRVKNLFRLVMEPSEKDNNHELLSVYTDIGVKPRRELEERGNKASTTDGYWFVKKGDIVVNKLLAWMGAIGFSEYDGVTSPAYDILRPKLPVNGYFYHYLFRSEFCSAELKRHSRGIMDMRLRLYFDKFGDVEVPYPPKEEQDRIIQQMESKMTEIDGGLDHLKLQITKLKEYKTTLINSAVTGKIRITPEMVA